MRIAGRRADGAKLVLIGGGLAVVLRGTQKSRPLALRRTDALGPWAEADNSLASRRVVDKQLAQARVSLALDAPVPVLNLVGPGKHSAKWHRCWEDVQAKGHDEQSAAAICTAQLGDESYDASIAEEVPNAIALDNPGGTNQYGGPYRGAGSDSAKEAGRATVEALRHAVGPVQAIERARKDAQAAQEGWATGEHHDRLARFHENQADALVGRSGAFEAMGRHGEAAAAHQKIAAASRPEPGHGRVTSRPDDLSRNPAPSGLSEADIQRNRRESQTARANPLSAETRADIKAGLKNWKDTPALPTYKPNPSEQFHQEILSKREARAREMLQSKGSAAGLATRNREQGVTSKTGAADIAHDIAQGYLPKDYQRRDDAAFYAQHEGYRKDRRDAERASYGSTAPIRERKASDYAGAPVTKSAGMTPIRERRSRDVMAEVRTSVMGPLGQYGAATRKRSKGED